MSNPTLSKKKKIVIYFFDSANYVSRVPCSVCFVCRVFMSTWTVRCATTTRAKNTSLSLSRLRHGARNQTIGVRMLFKHVLRRVNWNISHSPSRGASRRNSMAAFYAHIRSSWSFSAWPRVCEPAVVTRTQHVRTDVDVDAGANANAVGSWRGYLRAVQLVRHIMPVEHIINRHVTASVRSLASRWCVRMTAGGRNRPSAANCASHRKMMY